MLWHSTVIIDFVKSIFSLVQEGGHFLADTGVLAHFKHYCTYKYKISSNFTKFSLMYRYSSCDKILAGVNLNQKIKTNKLLAVPQSKMWPQNFGIFQKTGLKRKHYRLVIGLSLKFKKKSRFCFFLIKLFLFKKECTSRIVSAKKTQHVYLQCSSSFV